MTLQQWVPCARVALLAILVLQVHPSRAQSHFEEGYVVTLEGDTLWGAIDNRQWIENPREIAFKAPDDAGVRHLTVRSVGAFSVGGRRYQSRLVTVHQVPTDLDGYAIRGYEPAQRDTLVFLEAVIQGPLSLYALTQERQHLFLERDRKLTELIDRTYRVQTSRGWAEVSDDRFRQQLAEHVTGCPELDGRSERVPFDVRAIARFVRRYNECVGLTKPYYEQAFTRVRVRPGLIGGLGRSNGRDRNIRFADTGMVETVSFPGSSSWFLGVSIAIQLPGQWRRRAVDVHVAYRRYDADHLAEQQWQCVQQSSPGCDDPLFMNRDGHYVSAIEDLSLSFANLEFSGQFKNALSTGAVRPFLGIGATVSLPVSSSGRSQHTRTHHWRVGQAWQEEQVNSGTRDLQHEGSLMAGAVASLGLDVKGFTIEAAVQPTYDFRIQYYAGDRRAPLNLISYILLGYGF